MALTHALATNNYGEAKFIVATSASNGTHTTLASAMADASVGDTIFLRNSVTENVTITPGVNIASWSGSSLNVPSITGTLTMTAAGTSTISGLTLVTNSAPVIAVTGSAASNINVRNCYINATNNTAISYTTSDATSLLQFYNCVLDTTTTGIAHYSMSSVATLRFFTSRLANSGSSLTASSNSAGVASLFNTSSASVYTTSSTGAFNTSNGSSIDTSAINTACVTTAGTGQTLHLGTYFASGSASVISVGAGTTATISSCILNSSNTNPITGSGTLIYQNVSMIGSGKVINTTTQTGGIAIGGLTQAPSAGFIGEQIRSSVTSASPVTMTTSLTVYDITSISLTAGIWDISSIVTFSAVAVTGTNFSGGINSAATTLGIAGDQRTSTPYGPTAGSGQSIVVPSYRATLTGTTTYYLNAIATFTVGTPTAFGRISATRVG